MDSRKKVTSGAKVQEMCISRHGALVSFAYLLRFFQFPSDMHVSNPLQILWTVCVENVKPLSYLASSFGHNF